MNAEFYQGNRQRLYDSLPDHTLLLLFSGSSIRKTADENYPFYADRSFLYLTGIGQEHTVLMAEKDGEEVQETLYILPPDMLAERWTGKRFTPEEARARSGAAQIASSGEWENRLKLLMRSGRFERIAMDLYRHDPEDADTESIRMARKLRKWYPAATLTDISRQIRRQRTIKQPCEIEAMREAVKISRECTNTSIKPNSTTHWRSTDALHRHFRVSFPREPIISVFTIMSTQGRRRTAI